MALFQTILLILFLTTTKINAASLQSRNVPIEDEISDTDTKKDTDRVLLSNTQKIRIDLYQRQERDSQSAVESHDGAHEADTNPILQVLINQSETEPIANTTKTSNSAPIETTQVPYTPDSTKNSLIPPASVDANIAKLPNSGGIHKQGQIIIRLEF